MPFRHFPYSGEVRSVNNARWVMMRAALDNVGMFSIMGNLKLHSKDLYKLTVKFQLAFKGEIKAIKIQKETQDKTHTYQEKGSENLCLSETILYIYLHVSGRKIVLSFGLHHQSLVFFKISLNYQQSMKANYIKQCFLTFSSGVLRKTTIIRQSGKRRNLSG